MFRIVFPRICTLAEFRMRQSRPLCVFVLWQNSGCGNLGLFAISTRPSHEYSVTSAGSLHIARRLRGGGPSLHIARRFRDGHPSLHIARRFREGARPCASHEDSILVYTYCGCVKCRTGANLSSRHNAAVYVHKIVRISYSSPHSPPAPFTASPHHPSCECSWRPWM